MSVSPYLFVSYAKLDVSAVEEERLLRLADIERIIKQSLPDVFIDELHNYRGGHGAVAKALEAASVFCVIDGPNYAQTSWTRWEFQRARALSMPIFHIRSERSPLANASWLGTRSLDTSGAR